MPQRYLITGAAGFIGQRVSQLLLADGRQVVGVDNLNDAYDVRLKEYRLRQLQGQPGFQFHKLDISSREQVNSLAGAGPFDALIHLAARAGVRQAVENPLLYFETNLTGTLNLLEFCLQAQIPKFILASTSSVYGANAPLPTPETASSDRPLQPYSASKKAAEVLAYTYHYLHGIDATVVRYFTVYGPAGRPDMSMFRFVQWIAEGRPVRVNGDGSQTRGFTYIDDIAQGTIQALQPLGYEILNLGGHQVISIGELIQMIEHKLGQKAKLEYHPFHPADMQANLADVSRAKRILGWQPQIDLDAGVQRLVDWYLRHRDWASLINTQTA